MSDTTMGKIIKAGEVEVKKPFIVKQFDEDDGWQEIKITPDTYEYRVLNVNGWKPRQLKIDGDWIDVMGDCEELEALLNAVDETTTVANIAPTVDYMGHIQPIQYLSGNETSYESEYDNPDDKNKDKEKKEDDAWVSPIGKIIAGESVRKVLLSQLNESQGELKEDSMIDVYDDPRFSAYMRKLSKVDPDWEQMSDKRSDYETKVQVFKSAADSKTGIRMYPNHLEVSSPDLEKGEEDNGYTYWYFKIHDADLDAFADDLSSESSSIDYDWMPTYYIIYCDVPVKNGTPVQPVKDLVYKYYTSGKKPIDLIKELESLPNVGDVALDWDSV